MPWVKYTTRYGKISIFEHYLLENINMTKLDNTFFCVEHGIEKEYLPGRPAHVSNLYCPQCENVKQHFKDIKNMLQNDSNNIHNTLEERGKRYCKFKEHAIVTWQIKHAMQSHKNWEALTASQKEALDMIAHKIGRIMNGDPNYADSWHDIAGYATLVENELNENIPSND